MLKSISPTGPFEVDLDDGRTLSGKSKLADVIMWERSHKKGYLGEDGLSFQKILWIVFAALKRSGQIPEWNTANEFIDHVEDLRQEVPDGDDEEDDEDGDVVLPNPGEAATPA